METTKLPPMLDFQRKPGKEKEAANTYRVRPPEHKFLIGVGAEWHPVNLANMSSPTLEEWVHYRQKRYGIHEDEPFPIVVILYYGTRWAEKVDYAVLDRTGKLHRKTRTPAMENETPKTMVSEREHSLIKLQIDMMRTNVEAVAPNIVQAWHEADDPDPHVSNRVVQQLLDGVYNVVQGDFDWEVSAQAAKHSNVCITIGYGGQRIEVYAQYDGEETATAILVEGSYGGAYAKYDTFTNEEQEAMDWYVSEVCRTTLAD